MSDQQAWQQALKEKMEETGWSFLGGALSGGLMAGGRVVTNLSNQSRTGKQARTNGGAKQLYDMAMNMGEDTNSRQLASQIQLTEEGEIQAKDYEIGRLAQALMSETGDQYNKTVRGTVEKDIKEKLNAAGIYRNADEYAKIIADSMTGDGKMSARSKRTLAKDARAIEVWKKYNMPGEYADNLNSRIREATKAETAAQKSVAEAVTGRKIRSYEGGINLAGFDEIREAERNGAKRTGGKREVLINGQFAKLDSVRVVKEGDSWKLKLSVNGKDVSASDLQATDYGTAQIIRNAAVMPEFYGERFTNQMLEAQEKGRLKSDNILDDLQEAGMVRLAGYAGIAMPQTSLDRQLAGEIWAESLKEHAENRKAQVAGANRKESGTVSFDGDEYGTEAYNKKVSKLDGETRAKLDYVAGIVQRAGVDARFTDLSKTDTTTYGWENKKGIGINIGGLNYGTIEGKSTPTGKHDIVVTFGHELTHWLQRNSLAGYNRLEQYIMNQFAQQRGLKGLRQRLDYFMTQEGLSLEDAMSEVVANGSDQILGDEQVAQHIQQTDGKLYTQIKNFVQNLVDRMKKAITGTGMQDSMSRDARVIMANGINDLRKRWMGAWDEALSRVGQETTAEAQPAEEHVKLSKMETETGEGGLEEDKYFNRIIQNRDNYRGNTFIKVGTIKEGGALNQVGIPANDLRYDKSKINYNLKKHERWLTPAILAQIPEMLQNPIVITEYKAQANTITVFSDMDVNNQPVTVGIVVSKGRGGLLVQPKVRTVNLRSDYDRMINDESVLYITTNKKKATNWFQIRGIDVPLGGNQYGLIRRIQLTDENVNKKTEEASAPAAKASQGPTASASVQSIAQSIQDDNTRKSTAEMDDLYEQAYNTYDDESGEQLVAEAAEMAMPDSKIRDENGKLKVVYHQTNAVDDEGNPFTVFDMERARHTSDVVGAFFAPEYDQYHEYGERTYPVYLNIKNPAYDVYVDNSITNAGLLKRNELIAQGYDGIINTEDGKPYEYVAFYPEQIKSAEAFTEDDDGDLIPLSERFNVSKRDVRYSRAEEALDAGVWMANLTPSAVQTEDERVLMQAYKDKRISISLCLKRQIDYKAKIRELESKESLTGEQRTELENLQDKLEKQQERMAQLEKEMQQITSSEGYAGMMYRYNMVLKDFVQGRTSEQVRDTVEAMLNEVKAAQEQITRRAEELKNLEQTQAVKAMKSFMGKTSLGQQASMLRKQYNSTMNKAEVEDRLAAMALKLASGQDIQTDAEALAADLVDKIRGIRSENLESLRGITLNIGESLRNELKAENSSMKEIRGAIYGSGLVIKAEGNSRLTEQWNELRENNKALPDIDGMAEIDALHTIVDFISGELQASRGSEQYNVNMEEATAICYGAAASVTTYLVKDPAARKQITELMTQIKDLSRKTGSIAEGMDQLNVKMQEVVKAGYKAADWTSILQNDVHTAIDYYNKVARQAAQEEKAQVKKNLIEQLRSENARKLYEQQDKYEELIKNV